MKNLPVWPIIKQIQPELTRLHINGLKRTHPDTWHEKPLGWVDTQYYTRMGIDIPLIKLYRPSLSQTMIIQPRLQKSTCECLATQIARIQIRLKRIICKKSTVPSMELARKYWSYNLSAVKLQFKHKQSFCHNTNEVWIIVHLPGNGWRHVDHSRMMDIPPDLHASTSHSNQTRQGGGQKE